MVLCEVLLLARGGGDDVELDGLLLSSHDDPSCAAVLLCLALSTVISWMEDVNLLHDSSTIM